MGDGYLQFLRDPDQIRERGRLHFLHDLAPMNLEGDLADAEFCRRLLVEQSADHQGEHFAFAGGEFLDGGWEWRGLGGSGACEFFDDGAGDCGCEERFAAGVRT